MQNTINKDSNFVSKIFHFMFTSVGHTFLKKEDDFMSDEAKRMLSDPHQKVSLMEKLDLLRKGESVSVDVEGTTIEILTA